MRQAAQQLVSGESGFMVIPRRPRLAVIHGSGSDPSPLPAGRKSRILAVAGTRRGVGRTTVAVNLALALALEGKVLLIDADTAGGSVADRLGFRPSRTLRDVFTGTCNFADAIVEGPGNLRVLASPGKTGSPMRLDPFRRWRLCQALPGFQFDHDFVVVCLPPGSGADVLELAGRADEVIVVATPESAATTRARALMRGLTVLREGGPLVVMNRVRDGGHAEAAAERILSADRPESSRPSEVAAWIPEDETISQAYAAEELMVLVRPEAPASRVFAALARRLQFTPSNAAVPAVLSAGIGPDPGTEN